MARPSYANNARVPHAADWPATGRPHSGPLAADRKHGLDSKPRVAANCLANRHSTCFALACTCPCHRRQR